MHWMDLAGCTVPISHTSGDNPTWTEIDSSGRPLGATCLASSRLCQSFTFEISKSSIACMSKPSLNLTVFAGLGKKLDCVSFLGLAARSCARVLCVMGREPTRRRTKIVTMRLCIMPYDWRSKLILVMTERIWNWEKEWHELTDSDLSPL